LFAPGDKVGDYEIVAKLKAGGMATLFLGRRRGAAGFAKHVAIKVVHEHLAEDPSFVRMFVDEALLSARIAHPNVVHVEELRELEGRHFLVMEFVRGVSLWQLLATLAKRGRRVNPEVATYIASKVADGLHAAHEVRGARGELLNVVHRDVSPQNVLLSYQGNIKLIDFGVAKARGRLEETSGGSIKGKFRYMSPEQAWGRPVDRRSDVYALGTVLWELLTMRRRFEAKQDAMILDLVRDPEPVPASELADDIPPALDAVVLKAQAKRPEDRYQSAQEFRTALLRAVPEAAILHDSQIGALLRQVMADHIEKEATKLPQSVTGLTHEHEADDAPAAGEPLHTMTISDVGIELIEESTETSGPQAAANLSKASPAPGSPQGTPISVATPATPAVAPLAPRPRSNALLIAAITAGMIAAGLFGVVVVLGFHLSTDQPNETVVRPRSVGSSAPQAAPAPAPEPAEVPADVADASTDDETGEEAEDTEEAEQVAEVEEPTMVRRPRADEETGATMERTRMRADGDDPPRMRRRVLITDSF